MKKIVKQKDFFILHAILFLYSLGSICSKLASSEKFLSLNFCLFYGLLLLNLGIYAILWQQCLKKFSLAVAYANKSISIIWGIILGRIFFNEKISLQKIIGSIIIFIGISLVVTEKNE